MHVFLMRYNSAERFEKKGDCTMGTEARKSIAMQADSDDGTRKTRFALEVRDLYRFYHTAEEETLALRGVSFEVKNGELVAIMGAIGKREIDASFLYIGNRRAGWRLRDHRRSAHHAQDGNRKGGDPRREDGHHAPVGETV